MLRVIEGKVHRWAGGVSGQPGGSSIRPPRSAHQPEPIAHPAVVVAGDYLFDSTLNGVLRPATIATDLLRGGVPETETPEIELRARVRLMHERVRIRSFVGAARSATHTATYFRRSRR